MLQESPTTGKATSLMFLDSPTAAQTTTSPISSILIHLLPQFATSTQMCSKWPSRHQPNKKMSMSTEASYPIVWDLGTSVSVSNNAADFQGTLTMANASLIQVKGVSQGVTVSRQGMVLWYLMNTTGMLCAIRVPALYIPEANVRLLSTSSLLQVYKGKQIIQQPSGMTLSGINGDPT